MVEDFNILVDKLEALMLNGDYPTIQLPLKHFFFFGYYMRVIFMPAGAMATSLIHKTIHPYIVLKGKCKVISETGGIEEIDGLTFGMTEPRTRRVIQVLADTIWLTLHRTNVIPENDSEEAIQSAVKKIELDIIEWRENTVLDAVVKNNEFLTVKELTDAN